MCLSAARRFWSSGHRIVVTVAIVAAILAPKHDRLINLVTKCYFNQLTLQPGIYNTA